jgi:glycosyltransferase involved in cell wall biosynthesis
MRLGIDASNVRSGGGIIHLQKILEQAEPKKHRINRVIVWGGDTPLDNLPDKPWLELRNISNLNQQISQRLFWQQTKLGKLANEYCDLLFAPGGLYLGGFSPYVTMFQNMQIFESKERLREGFSKEWLRLSLLKWAQSQTFREASGLICLSEYSHNYLTQHHSFVIDQTPVQLIPHGTEKVKNNHILSEIKRNPINGTIRLLYVSTVKKYKHQWNLIDAVGLLVKEGFLIELNLIGEGDPQALSWMREAIHRNKSEKNFIFYHGSLPYELTLEWYNKADIFVFPSTCENLPVILLEAMTAGMPIASSDRDPMPEVLKDAGLYFNPESVTSIKNCLRYMIENPDLMQSLGSKAKKYSEDYSWKKCADETFAFLSSVYEKNKT